MHDKITVKKVENLPMPLIFLASAEDLARWQIDQLQWSFDQGHRQLAISCFDTDALGFEVTEAARTVLREVVQFLHHHHDVEHLTIFCGDDDAFLAYRTALVP